MKRHLGNGKAVIKSEYIKSNVVEVTYEDFSKKTMSTDVFKSMHKECK